MRPQVFCAESTLLTQSLGCHKQLPLYDQEPAGRALDHVITVTANLSDHVIRKSVPSPSLKVEFHP